MKARKITYFISAGVIALMLASCGTNGSVTQQPSAIDTETASEKPSAAVSDSEIEKKAEEKTGKDEAIGSKISSIYPDAAYADETDSKLELSSAVSYFRFRDNDEKSGDIIDMSVYYADNDIVKVITEDYGSEGRIISEYYYNGDMVAYMKQYKTDVFGIGYSYEEADLEDIEADYTNEVMQNAETALLKARKNTGKTLLYGYAGDEQGGVLKNVTVEIRNVAGDYTDETVTDGDGYFTLNVPQKEDTYNLRYIYDGCADSTLNDVHIVPGTPEYSLGRTYVAPAGEGVHATDVYLLNANAKAPAKLKEGEYLAELVSDDKTMKMRLVNSDNSEEDNGEQIKFKPSDSKNGYALFVEDDGCLSKEDMAGNIGRTYMTVTIFDRNGIIASFREPSGRLGTLWKVCTIEENGDISISGLMYTDSKGWPWIN